jgi:uncharacterized protein (DUF2336 family)
MSDAALLIAELEGAVKSISPDRRLQMLRQVTDLFLSDADRLNENQISVFDDVLVRLTSRMEAQALAQLSASLSGSSFAPRQVVRQLAHRPEASIAVPVLTRSSRLSDDELIEIAKTRSQPHLLAISGRPMLNEAVTDVLLERGDQGISRKLAANTGARFSQSGYSTLAEKASGDETLAEALGLRPDFPIKTLRELLSKATVAARDRLLKAAPPELRVKIQEAIRNIAEQVGIKPPEPIDYTQARNMAVALNRAGKLGDQTINRFAVQEEYSNVIAALSLLSAVKIEAIEPLIGNPRPDGLIVACKAARLNWSTTSMIVRNRPNCAPISQIELEQGREIFEALSLSAAQRTIRFWSARNAAQIADAPDTAVAISDG